MRMDRPPGGAPQPLLQADIEPFDDRADVADAGGEAVENAGLALAAMAMKARTWVCGSVIAGPWVGQ